MELVVGRHLEDSGASVVAFRRTVLHDEPAEPEGDPENTAPELLE
jgi:hypothetical protein